MPVIGRGHDYRVNVGPGDQLTKILIRLAAAEIPPRRRLSVESVNIIPVRFQAERVHITNRHNLRLGFAQQ